MAVMSRRIVGWGSSSMALIGPAMDSVLAADGVPFVNEGRGGETSHHTAARIGSLPLPVRVAGGTLPRDRKSTRLNSSHVAISYAVFCLKKKKRIRSTRSESTV